MRPVVVRSTNQKKTSMALLDAVRKVMHPMRLTTVTQWMGTPDLVHLRRNLGAWPSVRSTLVSLADEKF